MKEVSDYMSNIGKKGGKKSRRKLSKKQAQEMAKKRWANKKTFCEIHGHDLINIVGLGTCVRCGFVITDDF